MDKNIKTILIIKSTLERSFLMKKYQKNAFLKMSVFTEYNLIMLLIFSIVQMVHLKSQILKSIFKIFGPISSSVLLFSVVGR